MDALINIIAGLLGVIFITVSKMLSLQKDAETANVVFVYSKYLKRDALSIILSVFSVAIWLILFGEIAGRYPQIQGFIRTSFFVMGSSGAWVIQKLLGKTKTWIRSIVDAKTDVADGKVTP